MNVFEDLIVELQQENLLENTMIDTERAVAEADASLEITEEPNPPADKQKSGEGTSKTQGAVEHDDVPAPRKEFYGRDFFNKRAIDEVSSLQMVEHVLTGVEREYLKVLPRSFDDFEAKKALNAFLQMPDSANTEEHKKAEFDLMQETETWASALSDRDRNIPVSSLRQYCENTRPALSSQALLALGRFYRNSTHSENVRAKFDFVITRLFSRAEEAGSRALLFGREEMLEHVKKLYADWSSVPLYTADTDESNVLLTALSFEDLATESENAASFDQLIKSDFFSRVRLFKESISELFYAPSVIIAAIESNIRIGNAYVRLIDREHKKMDAGSIQKKYGNLNDQSVSDAAAWTLDLAEIIHKRTEAPIVAKEDVEKEPEAHRAPPPAPPPIIVRAASAPAVEFEDTSLGDKIKAQIKNINKWVLISCGLLLFASGALFIWANFFAGETVPATNVRSVPVDAAIAAYVSTTKVSGDTLYALLTPSWDSLPKDKRTDLLQKCLTVAKQQGAKQVQLVAHDGKPAGYASESRIDVDIP